MRGLRIETLQPHPLSEDHPIRFQSRSSSIFAVAFFTSLCPRLVRKKKKKKKNMEKGWRVFSPKNSPEEECV
ncbi:hypothetical protein CEXT_653431 [Caerostris extrusa]|uniref:Uncharacterized protein n=1 Tax=Caerostris extrusa TaxID=172846 RepID=A0AAV4WEB0_CAEEX|nr:hypothetical protein CEXT_653431 [Caerostris extrusa]